MNDRHPSEPTTPDVTEATPGPEDLERIEAGLTRQADRLRTEIAWADESESALRGDCDLDPADLSAKTVTIDQLHARTGQARERLQRTLAALDRLHAGRYGVCTECGHPLGRERLLVLPYAELCVTCRKRTEASSIG